MPRYFFNLNDGQKIVPDLEGTELADEDAARVHAAQVVRELARNREQTTESWRLAVCDVHGSMYFELSFASVQDATSAKPPVLRFLFNEICDSADFTQRCHEAGSDEIPSLPARARG